MAIFNPNIQGSTTVVATTAISSSYAATATSASHATTANTVRGLYLNVLTYGADPTGISDSTTAIQNAISAATASFEFISGSVANQGSFARVHQIPTVFFPKGKYLINNTITIGPGQELLGDSGATLVAGTVGMVMLKSLDPTVSQLKALYGTYGARNMKINNLVFDGDYKASIGLLLQSSAAGTVISNCRFYLINSSSLSPTATAATTAGSDTITISSPTGLQSNMLITLEGEDYPFAINTVNTGSGVTTLSRSPQNTTASTAVTQIPSAIALAGCQQTYIENVDAIYNGSGFYAIEFQPIQNDIGTTDMLFAGNRWLQNTYSNFLENVGGLKFVGNTFGKTIADRSITLKSVRGVSFISNYIESVDYATVGENGIRQIPMVDIQTATGVVFRDTHWPQDANGGGFRYVFNNKSDNTIIDGITTSTGDTAENPRFVDLGMRFTSINVGAAGSASLNLTNVTIDLQQGDYIYVNPAATYTAGNYQITSLDRTAKTATINTAYAGSTTGTAHTSRYKITSVASGGSTKLDLTLDAVPNALREGLYARFNFDSVYASGYYKIHDIVGSVVTITSSLSYTSTTTGLATPPSYSFTTPQDSDGNTTFTFPSTQYPYDVEVKDIVYLITTASQYNGEAAGSTKLNIVSVSASGSLTAIRVNSVPASINPDTVVYVDFSAGGTSGFYEVQGTSGTTNGYIYLNLPYVIGMAVNYITKPYYTEVLDVDPVNYKMTFDVEYSSSAASGYIRPADFAFIQQHKTIGSITVKNLAGQTSIRNLDKLVVDQFYAQNPDRAVIEQEFDGENNIKRPNVFWTNNSTTTPISLQRFGDEFERLAITDNSITWGTGSTAPYASLSLVNGQLQLQGTASWAINALTASYVNPLVQNAIITGSTFISSSNATQLQVGSNLLFVSRSGNVGIGTSTPTSASLVVNRSSSLMIAQLSSNDVQRFNFRNDGVFFWGSNAIPGSAHGYLSWDTNEAILSTGVSTYNLALMTGGSDRIFISASGNVGIGTNTTSSAYRLQIDANGASNSSLPLALTSVDANNRVGILFASSSISSGRQHRLLHRVHIPNVEWLLGTSAGENATWRFLSRDDTNYGVNILAPFNGGTSYLNTGLSQSLFSLGAGSQTAQHINISSSGNVGISTTTPSHRLDVSGSGNFTANLTVTGSTTLHNGQTTIQGAGATSATTALLVRNSNASSALTITNARSSSFGGNVDIAGDLNANNSASTRKFQAGYFYDIHPEASNAGIIPFYSNDIAYNTLRGGQFTASFGSGSTYTLNTSQIEAIFDGSPNYCIMDPTQLSGSMTASIVFPQTYTFGNIIGFSFGSPSWVARDFTVEILVTGSYVTLDTQTGYTAANYTKYFQYAGLAVTGARITFSNFATPANTSGFRIAEIFLLNYNGQLGKAVFMGRDGGAVYKPITIQSGSTSTPAYSSLTDTNTGIYFPAADTLGFVEGGVEAMRINSSGQVGIGTTSPAFTLDVSGSGRFTNGLTVTGSLIAPSITGSLQGTASYATQALSASFLLGSVTSASYAATSSLLTGRLSTYRSSGTGSMVGTGTTSLTATTSFLIPANTFTTGDILRVRYRVRKLATNANTTTGIYINTTNDISTATTLGILTANTTSMQMKRDFYILSATGINTEHVGVGTSLATDDAATGRAASTINWAVDQYIIFGITHTNTNDSGYSTMYYLERV